MTPDDQEQIDILCAQIATEQDQEKFVKLVQELNDLLDRENLDRINLDRNDPAARPPGSTSAP